MKFLHGLITLGSVKILRTLNSNKLPACQVVTIGEQVLHPVTPLSDVQGIILSLLDFPLHIYVQLVNNFPRPTSIMTESWVNTLDFSN